MWKLDFRLKNYTPQISSNSSHIRTFVSLPKKITNPNAKAALALRLLLRSGHGIGSTVERNGFSCQQRASDDASRVWLLIGSWVVQVCPGTSCDFKPKQGEHSSNGFQFMIFMGCFYWFWLVHSNFKLNKSPTSRSKPSRHETVSGCANSWRTGPLGAGTVSVGWFWMLHELTILICNWLVVLLTWFNMALMFHPTADIKTVDIFKMVWNYQLDKKHTSKNHVQEWPTATADKAWRIQLPLVAFFRRPHKTSERMWFYSNNTTFCSTSQVRFSKLYSLNNSTHKKTSFCAKIRWQKQRPGDRSSDLSSRPLGGRVGHALLEALHATGVVVCEFYVQWHQFLVFFVLRSGFRWF